MAPRISSFADFLASYAPDLLPGGRRAPCPASSRGLGHARAADLPHATTIVAAAFDGGVVHGRGPAGHRRAT